MSIVADVLGFMSGSGLTTIVATAGGAIMKYKERKLEMSHQLALIPHEERKLAVTLKLHRLQTRSDHVMADRDLEGQLAHVDAELLGDAINADASATDAAMRMDNMPWGVGAFKTLFRPILTILLWTAVFLILAIKPTSSPYMNIVVGAITNGAEASLGLWFGSRMMADRQAAAGSQQWTT